MDGSILVTAPVRVAEVGGWTDTWFAGYGRVCSLAVRPGARVVFTPLREPEVRLAVALTGDEYAVDPRVPPGRHPVLEAAITALAPPMGVRIEVGAQVPPGSGLGTSAAVTVALLAGLAHLRGMDLSAPELAAMAHGVELRVGLESGVQDQWAAAHGGASDLTIDYPGARRDEIDLTPALRGSLDARLVTVYLGRPHSSSEVHEEVIAGFAAHDPTVDLTRLRLAAADAVAALRGADLGAYAAALVEAHETVRSFHRSLVSADADRAVDIARAHGSIGWKANGAAGDGGSITIVGPADHGACDRLRSELAAVAGWSVLDHRISERGVVVDVARAE